MVNYQIKIYCQTMQPATLQMRTFIPVKKVLMYFVDTTPWNYSEGLNNIIVVPRFCCI